MRTGWRRLWFGLSTVLGFRPRGFFIPYRYAGSVATEDYPALRPFFQNAEPRFEEILADIDRHGNEIRRILRGEAPARFDQSWFPRLDAAAAYAIVRREKPARIVEIGSGHSTRFLARAVADGELATRITCIDPAPRASLHRLRVEVEHLPVLLGDADATVFDRLEAGDVLFVDSSHIAMPGTDVDRLFLDVLPRLKRGVLVHVHDVTLPSAYPRQWAWRGYNEQLLVGALLQGGGYELLFSSHYVKTALASAVTRGVLAEIPLVEDAPETSLWLRKG